MPSQVSRAQILNKATDYIQYMVRRNASHQAEMDDLKKQNEAMLGPEPGEWATMHSHQHIQAQPHRT